MMEKLGTLTKETVNEEDIAEDVEGDNNLPENDKFLELAETKNDEAEAEKTVLDTDFPMDDNAPELVETKNNGDKLGNNEAEAKNVEEDGNFQESEAKTENTEGNVDSPENENIVDLAGCRSEQDVEISVVKDEMEQKDGLEQRMGGGEEGNRGDAEIVDKSVDKRRNLERINGEEESGDGVHGKKKVKDEPIVGKVLLVGRVLRSRTNVNGAGEKQNSQKGEESETIMTNNGEINDDGSERKIAGQIEKESNHSSGAVTEKRKRGRPPKDPMNSENHVNTITENEDINDAALQTKLLGMTKNKNNPSGGAVTEKRKRGRPPKDPMNLDNHMNTNEEINDDVFERKPVGTTTNETNPSGGAVSEKRKRGRPPKDPMNSDNRVNTMPKHKRGRRPKSSESCDFVKSTEEVKNESYQSALERSDESSDDSVKKLKAGRVKLKGNARRKRGRPPKSPGSGNPAYRMEEVNGEEIDQSALEKSDDSCEDRVKKVKRGMGVQSREIPRRICGKPAKLHESCSPEKRMEEPIKEEINHLTTGICKSPSKGFVLKESNLKVLNSANTFKCKNAKGEGCDAGCSKKESKSRRTEKQAVREKIVEMLLSAGWTVEYRPRYGRKYNDAVYVSPGGRTHWSVTLAYRVLKESYENDGSDSTNFKAGFNFTPIPDDELGLLKKVMNKERCDKNKKKEKRKEGKKSREEDEDVIGRKIRKGKLPKRHLGSLVGRGGNMLKKRAKLKASRAKHDDTADLSKDVTAISSRGLEIQDRKRFGLVARSSNEGDKSSPDGYVLYNGKRSVLSWMIDLGTVPLDGNVHCAGSTKTGVLRKGRIMQDGICCDCCSGTFAVSEFESHAGGISCQPFGNIYMENGSSLLQCLLESWNKQEEPVHKGFHFVDVSGEDPNDDTCGICGDGGDLVCCDGCPSTFHQSCLDIKKFPSGLWHCIYCTCKFCGMFSTTTCQKNDTVSSAMSSLLTCCLCEEKYHLSCVQSKDAASDDSDQSFCGKKCQKLYEGLQSLLGVKHDLGDGFACTIVRRFDIGSDISIDGVPRKIECNSKVAVAWLVMDECFSPMDDYKTGTNLIRNVVYNFGSNFNRLNYGGFVTAILERGDETIAAASIRIHGNNLAEMPFIGTRYMYRRQGMCRRLLSGIETALSSLNVEKLVIPAISELRETWTSVFGFKVIEGSSKKEMKKFNMIVFPGVDMLQKPLLQQPAEDSASQVEGLESLKLDEQVDNEVRSTEDCSTKLRDLNEPSEVEQSSQACMDNGLDLNEPSEVTPNPRACTDGCSISTDVTLVSEQVK